MALNSRSESMRFTLLFSSSSPYNDPPVYYQLCRCRNIRSFFNCCKFLMPKPEASNAEKETRISEVAASSLRYCGRILLGSKGSALLLQSSLLSCQNIHKELNYFTQPASGSSGGLKSYLLLHCLPFFWKLLVYKKLGLIRQSSISDGDIFRQHNDLQRPIWRDH
jgi:hypothetical protein